MFPDGPRTVTVAYTNIRSGVTVLIEHYTVYRYRWNRKNKVFYVSLHIDYVKLIFCMFQFIFTSKLKIAICECILQLARKSPQRLTKKMPVYPRAGFQWIDGNQVLLEVSLPLPLQHFSDLLLFHIFVQRLSGFPRNFREKTLQHMMHTGM